MYLIDRIVAQEKKRNLEMQEAYKQKISKLPQGQLYVRTLNKGRAYCYLKYRKNGKVVTEYAGTADCADALREQIDKRKHLEGILSILKKVYNRIEKMERIK